MRERIDIIVPDREIERNDERRDLLRNTHAFEPTERVPVQIAASQWYILAVRGRTCADYVRSPLANLREQILNRKWLIENVLDDKPIPTDSLTFTPDLGCLRGVEFDMDIIWQEDQPPKCVHRLTEPEQIDRLEVPEPSAGLNAKRIAWWRDMCAAAESFDVRVNGQPLDLDVTLRHPGGPIPSAFALAGMNLFLWLVTEPERVHRLMHIVTESHIRCTRFFDQMMGRSPEHALGMGLDTAEMMSADMFREFVVPYYLRVWNVYKGPRSIHNCGRNEHLLDSFRDDLGISAINWFGYATDPEAFAEKLGGRVRLSGGPHPMLVKDGSRDAILAECERYIRTIGRHGGYILGDGSATVVGTPVENLQLMVRASQRVGCPM